MCQMFSSRRREIHFGLHQIAREFHVLWNSDPFPHFFQLPLSPYSISAASLISPPRSGSSSIAASLSHCSPQPRKTHLRKMAFVAGAALPTHRAARSNRCTPRMARERTFVAVKPDGVQRGLIGRVVSRFEDRGFQLVAMKTLVPSRELAETHYAALQSKPFYPSLVDFISSGPVCAMVWEGEDAVATARTMIGQTSPTASAPGSSTFRCSLPPLERVLVLGNWRVLINRPFRCTPSDSRFSVVARSSWRFCTRCRSQVRCICVHCSPPLLLVSLLSLTNVVALLLVSANRLSGVVHICDTQRDPVSEVRPRASRQFSIFLTFFMD